MEDTRDDHDPNTLVLGIIEPNGWISSISFDCQCNGRNDRMIDGMPITSYNKDDGMTNFCR